MQLNNTEVKGTTCLSSFSNSKQPFNQFMFDDNSYKSRIILSLIMIKQFY